MSAQRALLPRSTPAASGVSSRAIVSLLDWLEAESVEIHSIMVVRHGHVVAEGWWAPYSADRPHLLYSMTKSFTSIAVGLTIADGLLSLDDRVVDVLPDHVPADISEQGRRLTVHHLLSMTVGHATDSLEDAWQLEPDDLVKGFLRVPFSEPEGTRHTYDNATTFILARMVERVTGRGLPEFLDERLFQPMGIEGAEWDRVGSGAAFGFHGLHLRTEAVAAFGQLLLRGGVWGDRQLIPREWIELATSRHIETLQLDDAWAAPDFLCGYGYQFWRSRHGFFANGAFGQQCLVVPDHDLVIVVTSALDERQPIPGAFWDFLLPGLDHPDTPEDDHLLTTRLHHLAIPLTPGAPTPTDSAAPTLAVAHSPAVADPATPTDPADATPSAAPALPVKATLDASADNSVLPDGTPVALEPIAGDSAHDGWHLQLGADLTLDVGYGEWRESSPLGRPAVANGAWQDNKFIADLYVITTPHRVRVAIDATTGTATATWCTVPLTGPDLTLHLRSPLMTRPTVA
ncbi:serine hydrolase [Kribbella sp. NPDC006257]|uniref:serine hydrolase domain-containing protein n=1 Tax=Kribbella sp. NPDC006257 TaxID=3156738 RepID=UPI0033B6AECD